MWIKNREDMSRRLITIMIILMTGITLTHAEGWIRINQLGYLPEATKVAVLISQAEVRVTEFELVDAYTGQTVYHSTAAHAMGAWGQMQGT